MKRNIKFFMCLIILLISFCIYNFNSNTNAYSAISLNKVKGSTVISSDYNFAPRFIEGQTKCKTYGMTNYTADGITTNNTDPKPAVSARLVSNNQKNKIWIKYENVGTYKGKVIDLKVILADWEYLQPANTNANSSLKGVNYPTVFFRTDAIAIHLTGTPAISNPVFNFEFYENGTNTMEYVKGHLTFNDMDGDQGGSGMSEYMTPIYGFDEYYVANDTYLSIVSGKIINNTKNGTISTTKQGWVTCTFSGSSLRFIYSRNKDQKNNDFRDITVTTSKKTRTCFQYVINSYSIAPFEFNAPIKSVDKSKVFEEEEFIYKISQYVSENYYPGTLGYDTTYTITDNLDTNLYIPDTNKIIIVDESNTNVTSNFNINYSNNILEVIPQDSFMQTKAAYGNTFEITFPVKIREGSNLSSINNKVLTSATVNEKTNNNYSNTVTTDLKYNLSLSKSSNHCTITGESSVIVNAGDNNTFIVTITPDIGYELKCVTVDEEDYPIENLIKNSDGSYTLKITDQNILENINHTLNAEANLAVRDIQVTKKWEDLNNKYQKRPESIKIELLKDETKIDECILNVKEGQSSCIFRNIPKYNDSGEKINYTIKESAIKENDLYFYNKKISGDVSNGFEIINSLKFDETEIDATLDKTASEEITSSKDLINYNINYVASLDKILGNANILIVDKLPYKIDTEKSNLDGGIYNEDEKTITWSENVEGIDTYLQGKKTINISKNIFILYCDIDLTQNVIENNVKSTIKIDTSKATHTLEKSAETHINVYGNLKVSHYDINTNEKIADDEKYTQKYQTDYSTKPKDELLDDYIVLKIDGNETGKYIEGTININYYYAKKANLQVKYIDKATNEILDSYTENGYESKEYETTERSFDNYTLVDKTNNTKGNMEISPIVINYYYLYNCEVKVNHIDKVSKEVLGIEEINKLEGDNIKIASKEFDGYVLVEKPSTEEYTLKKEKQEVNYYYAKSTRIEVNYIDQATNEILDSYTENGYESKGYETTERSFDNYTLVDKTNNTKGNMEVSTIVINYYYLYKCGVKANYIDKATNEVIDNKIFEDLEGRTIKTLPNDIDGYVLIEKPKKEEYTLKKQEQEVNYYYAKKVNLEVKYIDKATNEILDSYTKSGYEGKEYETSAKDFDNYNLVEITGLEKGLLEREGTGISYYYLYKCEVKVNYVDNGTNEVLDSRSFTGPECNHITTSMKEIKGYTLIEKPVTEQYILKKEKQTVNYYYAKNTNINVNYIDKITNETLDSYTEDGYEGKEYITEAINIENYTLIEMPENQNGKMQIDEITVNYYYLYNSSLIVNYIDKKTGEILDNELIQGLEGNRVTTSLKEIEGYTIIESPNVEEYILNKEKQEVNYYYTKNAKVIVKYIDTEGRKLEETIIINGYIGLEYITEQKEIGNYKLLKVDGKKEGEMSDTEITVTYIYEIKSDLPKTGKINNNYSIIIIISIISILIFYKVKKYD